MMTLYIAFEAIERGEIKASSKVLISKFAAAEPPSKLGLRAGSRVELRYLIRAAAVKSANDAATAIGEAISGSEAAFSRRMTQTARAMGMKRTTFKNAHGLTQSGHLSTARDMSVLGRHMIYDYPDYYHLFSRQKVDAGLRTVSNTNRRLLSNYRGADGIKTGYTRAAGYNLVASAERGRERVIATVFGGRSTATRNARVAELLDLGFGRSPTWARVRKPKKPRYIAPAKRDKAATLVAKSVPAPKGLDRTKGKTTTKAPKATGKVVRTVMAPKRSIRPVARPIPQEILIAKVDDKNIDKAILQANQSDTVTEIQPTSSSLVRSIKPQARPTGLTRKPEPEIKVARAVVQPVITPKPRPAAALVAPKPKQDKKAVRLEIVPRAQANTGAGWAITLGKYPSRYQAERVLVRMALAETGTLDGATRLVKKRSSGYEALFLGLSRDNADLACRRLTAQNYTCLTISPS